MTVVVRELTNPGHSQTVEPGQQAVAVEEVVQMLVDADRSADRKEQNFADQNQQSCCQASLTCYR